MANILLGWCMLAIRAGWSHPTSSSSFPMVQAGVTAAID